MFEYLIVDKIHDIVIAFDCCIGKYAWQSKKGGAFFYLENIKNHKQVFDFYLKQIKK
ncbi:MAG: hypothetical protein IKP65_03395 [Alphaproteobacteria bacterium]|nr:hypothetical protein [Alphaproteobacteria bacterium]